MIWRNSMAPLYRSRHDSICLLPEYISDSNIGSIFQECRKKKLWILQIILPNNLSNIIKYKLFYRYWFFEKWKQSYGFSLRRILYFRNVQLFVMLFYFILYDIIHYYLSGQLTSYIYIKNKLTTNSSCSWTDRTG